MEGFGAVLSFAVIWFWLCPESAGRWLAKAKRGFAIERVKLERKR